MEKGYISGEEYQAMQHPSHKQHPMQRMFKLPVVIAGLVLVLLIGLMAGWLGGVAHQKSIDNKLTSTGTQQPGSGGNGSVMCASGQSCAGSRGIMCSSGSGGVCTHILPLSLYFGRRGTIRNGMGVYEMYLGNAVSTFSRTEECSSLPFSGVNQSQG